MALIKCPECGQEVSEYATQCPHCKQKISKKEQEKRTVYGVAGEEKKIIIEEVDTSSPRIKKKIFFIIMSVLLIILGGNLLQKHITPSNDKQITFCESLLGREFDKEGKLNLDSTDRKYMENCTLFEMRGDVTIPFKEEERVSRVIFKSKEICDNEEYVEILKEIVKIYGEHVGLDWIQDVNDNQYSAVEISSGYSWEVSDFTLTCYRDQQQKIIIEWENK